MKYLLDTNILSEPLKADPDPSVIERIEQHQTDVSTAAPVWHELQYGRFRLPRSKKRNTIERYLQDIILPSIPIFAYDEAAAAWHALQRAMLSQRGRAPSFVDGQIAAIAHVNDLIMVTRNTADFAEFEDFTVESWHTTVVE